MAAIARNVLRWSDAASIPLNQIDVSSPALYHDDAWRPFFARLRAQDPVHYCSDSPYGAYWSLTKFDDISHAELDHGTFSSSAALGGIQIEDFLGGRNVVNFIRMDPPEHTAQRKLISPIVAPANLINLEPLIRSRTENVLDGLPRNEPFDWADRISTELTSMMLATLFDVPLEDRRKLTYWSDVRLSVVGAPDSLINSEEERMAEMAEMAAYFRAIWDRRIHEPPKFDLISMLAHGEATRNMDLGTFVGNLVLLIIAGNDTTRNSMSASLLALAENPDEATKLRSNPQLVQNFVSEVIRYHTPVLHMRRTVRADIELRGRMIPAGSKVVLWYISGNRDEEKIPDADKFIIDRAKVRQHLSFGAGIHRCVGDRLAELQIRILWEEILKRDLKFEVLGEPDRLYSNFIRGIRRMPVRIH
ncbi:cytochrome P450 [Bradyrhizobium vignae]|uniref:cytochrome P450 n=1 Tax=Bradyrhizobium vignae TaxID=1549949 RepID=UPI00100A9D06|nr:cytochrome P450 [Bradyrhizobium vignae]RXH06673.1 cytochrome P450 [Bradyrhizobium vignae]